MMGLATMDGGMHGRWAGVCVSLFLFLSMRAIGGELQGKSDRDGEFAGNRGNRDERGEEQGKSGSEQLPPWRCLEHVPWCLPLLSLE
jgi:hypothetical protein